MYIISKKEVNLKVLEESDLMIHVSKDGKTFSVIKHRNFEPSEDKNYHISQLPHILLAGRKK